MTNGVRRSRSRASRRLLPVVLALAVVVPAVDAFAGTPPAPKPTPAAGPANPKPDPGPKGKPTPAPDPNGKGKKAPGSTTTVQFSTVATTAPLVAALGPDVCNAMEAASRPPDPQLGSGITVSTGQVDNLFPAGMQPSVQVDAGPVTPGDTLRLSVRDQAGVVSAQDVSLSPGTQTVSLPDGPGWFKVLAEQHVGTQVLSSTCLWYGAAAPTSSLDPAALPPGEDWGGPAALRDVDLHAQLGLPVVRRQIDVATFLANPVGDPLLAEAATKAASLGLRLVVQIGQGGPAETAAVAHGTWGSVVRQIVAANPAVRYWEAWNEPNTYMFFRGSVRDYVSKVLAPFAASVRAANPQAQVVGGSALGDDPEWWHGFARLGGFRLVDIVGVHPYTWGWGAPETQGLSSVLSLVRSLANTSGGRGKPVFDTESAFPSAWKGTGATIWNQANFTARKLILERSLGVLSGQFLVEGGWQNWGVIDPVFGVKPAALAMSTTSQQLAGRRFLGWTKVAARHVMVARFGPSSSDSRGLSVVWSTGAAASVALRRVATGHDEFGARITARRYLHATGSPVFLTGTSVVRPLPRAK